MSSEPTHMNAMTEDDISIANPKLLPAKLERVFSTADPAIRHQRP